MNKLFIIRGPSGSGKTTIAKTFHLPVVEADDFFIRNGHYEFDAKLLFSAHKQCFERAQKYIENKENFVISNTNTTFKELNQYIELAKNSNYEVIIYRTPQPWIAIDLFNRNKHAVPLGQIKNQINRYQKYINEIEWKDLTIF